MSKDIKVLGYQMLNNYEVQLHTQEELNTLVKARVLTPADLAYNDKLGQAMEKEFWLGSKMQEGQSGHKKLAKDLSKIGHLGETDRVMIISNKCRNEAELRLKVPNIENISAKELKSIIEAIK